MATQTPIELTLNSRFGYCLKVITRTGHKIDVTVNSETGVISLLIDGDIKLYIDGTLIAEGSQTIFMLGKNLNAKMPSIPGLTCVVLGDLSDLNIRTINPAMLIPKKLDEYFNLDHAATIHRETHNVATAVDGGIATVVVDGEMTKATSYKNQGVIAGGKRACYIYGNKSYPLQGITITFPLELKP